jgi:hypothetical protein
VTISLLPAQTGAGMSYPTICSPASRVSSSHTLDPEPDGKATRIQALARGRFRNLSRVESPDGSGHLEFSGTQGDHSFDYFNPFKFAHVREVRRVEQIVRSNLITSDSNVRESREQS